MKHLATRRLLPVVVALTGTVQSAQGQAPTVHTEHVAAALDRVSEGLVGAIGVAARDLETGTTVFLNGDDPFPMASTFKVAVAVTLLNRVEAGELSLTDVVEVEDEEWVLSDVIATNFIHPGVALSIANVMEVMITHSDNTATNVALRLAGGANAVNRQLAALGIEGMRVDRSTSDYSRDFYGAEPGRENLAEAVRRMQMPGVATDPQPVFEADPRDQSTPRAMLDLLGRIHRGDAMSEEHTAFLLGIMSRTVTGPGRIRGMLPRSTPVAHKTGTLGGVSNDVGYVTLPDGRHFALVVFTRGSSTPPSERDRAIAEVARTLYDYFLLQPGAL